MFSKYSQLQVNHLYFDSKKALKRVNTLWCYQNIAPQTKLQKHAYIQNSLLFPGEMNSGGSKTLTTYIIFHKNDNIVCEIPCTLLCYDLKILSP